MNVYRSGIIHAKVKVKYVSTQLALISVAVLKDTEKKMMGVARAMRSQLLDLLLVGLSFN